MEGEPRQPEGGEPGAACSPALVFPGRLSRLCLCVDSACLLGTCEGLAQSGGGGRASGARQMRSNELSVDLWDV